MIDELRDALDIITGKRRQEGSILVFVIFLHTQELLTPLLNPWAVNNLGDKKQSLDIGGLGAVLNQSDINVQFKNSI